jgi:lipoate-protein ligase B
MPAEPQDDFVSQRSCRILDLGLVPYAQASEWQRRAVAARKAGAIADLLLLCEHPHVITLGRNGREEHLLASSRVLRQMSVEFHSTDRGGDITYHGPGQLVGYPILDLKVIRRDVGWYVRQLEEVLIRTAADFGVAGRREPGMTGVWVETSSIPEKLAAIGVHLSRWVTSHGFAFNVATDLRYFDLIVPCGIAGRKATSLERVLARPVNMEEVKRTLGAAFAEVFECSQAPMSLGELEQKLEHTGHAMAVPAGG